MFPAPLNTSFLRDGMRIVPVREIDLSAAFGQAYRHGFTA